MIIHLKSCIYKHWRKSESSPSNLSLIFPVDYIQLDLKCLIDYIIPIPIDNIASLRVYDTCYDTTSSIFFPTLPSLQLQFERGGQVTTPCVKLSNFGVLGLNNDVAVMTDCQYGGKIMYMVRK